MNFVQEEVNLKTNDMKLTMKLGAVMIAAATLMTTACKKDEVEPEMEGEDQGQMTVRMTDAPADYIALNVELEGIEAYSESTGWVMLNSETQSFNVLDLTDGAEIELASDANLEAGLYTQLRLTFGDENSITYMSSIEIGGIETYTEINTDISLDGDNEVIVTIDQEVSSQNDASILLDFDAGESIVEVGAGFILDPNIEFVANEDTGVEGEIEGAESAMIMASGDNGDFSTYVDANGEFMLNLEAGTYDVTIYASGQDVANGASESVTLENVTVVNGSFTNITTVNLAG